MKKCANPLYAITLALMLSLGTSPAAAESADLEGIGKLRILLSKLSETVKANRDLAKLRELGMPESEVVRLRNALDMKVKQLTEDTIYVIRSI